MSAERPPVEPDMDYAMRDQMLAVAAERPPVDPLREALEKIARPVEHGMTNPQNREELARWMTRIARAALAAAPRPEGLICGHPLSNGAVCTEKPHGEDRWHTSGHPFDAIDRAALDAAAPRPEGLDVEPSTFRCTLPRCRARWHGTNTAIGRRHRAALASAAQRPEGLPRMTVDPETGAIYVTVRVGEQSATRELDAVHELLADYDADDNLLGVEILSFDPLLARISDTATPDAG